MSGAESTEEAKGLDPSGAPPGLAQWRAAPVLFQFALVEGFLALVALWVASALREPPALVSWDAAAIGLGVVVMSLTHFRAIMIKAPFTRIAMGFQARVHGRPEFKRAARGLAVASTALDVVYLSALLFAPDPFQLAAGLYYVTMTPAAARIYLREFVAYILLTASVFFQKVEIAHALEDQLIDDGVSWREAESARRETLAERKAAIAGYVAELDEDIRRSAIPHPIPYFLARFESTLTMIIYLLIGLFAASLLAPRIGLEPLGVVNRSALDLLLAIIDVIIQFAALVFSFGLAELSVPILASAPLEVNWLALRAVFFVLSASALFFATSHFFGAANLYLDLRALAAMDFDALGRELSEVATGAPAAAPPGGDAAGET